MVGGVTDRSLSPAPTVEETVPHMAQQTHGTAEPQASVEESRPEPSATTGTGGPVAAQAEEEEPTEAGLVDIASILGALTVTVVRSSL
jgi:predicted secreted protein